MANKRGIPLPSSTIKDPAVRMTVQAIYEVLQGLTGNQGKTIDRAATLGDLQDAGLIRVVNDKIYAPKVATRFKLKQRNATGYTGSYDMLSTTGQTMTLNIVNGIFVDYEGDFEAVNPEDGTTITIQVRSGLIVNEVSRFDVLDNSGVTVALISREGRVWLY